MKEKVLRIVLDEDVYRRFKMLCVKKDLSFTKQTNAIIKNFVEIQEYNDKIMEKIKS